MVARRLNSSQKQEILEGYRSGKTAVALAKDYDCSPNTVVRTVKGMLPSEEYFMLKESRLKESALSQEEDKLNNKEENSDNISYSIASPLKEKSEESVNNENEISHINSALKDSNEFGADLEEGEDISRDDFTPVDLNIETNNDEFNELIPLVSSFGFESEEQKVSWKPLVKGLLPEVVYMLIDKKIELDSKPLSAFPEWSFLPDDEKSKQAICLFSNQRSAKRSCDRSQRVIKVPDSNVFVLSTPYLLLKGITRIILEDSLISLDSN